MGQYIWRLKGVYFVDRNVKCFVAVQQYKGKPLLRFHNNNQCFYTVERYVEVNNTKCTHCCVVMTTMVNQTCHNVKSCCMACQLRVLSSLAQGWPRAGSGPGENSFRLPHFQKELTG